MNGKKDMFTKTAVPVLLASIIFNSASASATTSVYNNSVDFLNAVAEVVTDDYENPGYEYVQSNLDMNAVLNETKYLPTTWDNYNFVTIDFTNTQSYCAGCNGSFKLDFTSSSVAGVYGVYGLGFDVRNALFTVYVGFGDGSFVDFSLPDGLGYFGITSELGIKTAYFGWSGLPSDGSGYLAIDNLSLARTTSISSVPEPKSFALMLAGLGLFAFAQKRKK